MANLFYAVCHVRLGENVIRPGEVFEADPADAGLARLLELGAAKKCAVDQLDSGEYVPAEAEEEEIPKETENRPLPREKETENRPLSQVDVMDGIVAKPRRSRK